MVGQHLNTRHRYISYIGYTLQLHFSHQKIFAFYIYNKYTRTYLQELFLLKLFDDLLNIYQA